MKILLIVVIVIISGQNYKAQTENNISSGREAPNFKLKNIYNTMFDSKNFIGKVPVLLCFWSTCCRTSVAQVEAYSEIYNEYQDLGFIMLAIATDDEKTVAKVKPFSKSKQFNFEVLYDTDGATARIYYVYNIPYCVLINKDGKIIYSHLGYKKGDEIEMEKELLKILRN